MSASWWAEPLRVDVHVAPSSLRDDPQDLVRLGVLGFQILGQVDSETLQLG